MAVSRVVLPVLDLEQNDNTLHKTVLKGAKNYTVQKINNDNQSAGSISFTVTPPSQNTIIDRRIDIEYNATLTPQTAAGVGTFFVFGDSENDAGAGGGQAAGLLSEANIAVEDGYQIYDSGANGLSGDYKSVLNGRQRAKITNAVALRQFPFNSAVQNLILNINGTSISVEPREHLHSTLQYTSCMHREQYYNDVPHHPDTHFGNYKLLNSGNEALIPNVTEAENPMSIKSSRDGEIGRGAYILKRGTPEVVAALPGNDFGSISVTIREPLFISPLSLEYGSGMTNINQLKVTITLDTSKLERMMSVNPSTNFCTKANANGNDHKIEKIAVAATANDAKLLVRYYTPQDDIRIPNEIVLPYHEVLRHNHDQANAVAYNTLTTSVGNNRRLNQIPEAVYLWVQPRQSDLTQQDADGFAFLESVKCQFQNQVGILSNHNNYQLLTLAQDNGCDVKNLQEAKTRGYCLKLVFGKDIPLPNNESAGTRGDYDIQFEVQYRHFAIGETPNMEVKELYVYNGQAVISPNECRVQTGLLDLKDNIDAEEMGDKYHGGSAVGGSMVGGSIWGSIKKGLGKVGHFVEKGVELAPKAVALAEKVAPMLGGGMHDAGGSAVGGSIVGGSKVGGAMHGGNMHYMSRRK